MAPTSEPTGPLGAYLTHGIPDVLTKYDALWDTEDPEENPYKTKYEARALLEAAVNEVKRLLADTTEGPEAVEGREMIARLHLFLGKNFYFCEEVPAAEQHFTRSLECYLRLPVRLEPKPFVHIHDVLNQLGMLWCNRGGHAEGMNFLRRAQIMFLNRPDSVREAEAARSEDNYTLTMFYLAQAYGALQKPGLSARFCAETMSRQLEHNTAGTRSKEVAERDPFDCKDWVRNCCSLSDFFVNECMFWTAEYLMHAAIVMCDRCVEVCGFKPGSLEELRAECLRDAGNIYCYRLKFMKTCAENPAEAEEIWRGERKPGQKEQGKSETKGSRLSFRCSADGNNVVPPVDGDQPIHWDSVFPEVVFLEDEEAHDNRLAEETEEATPEAEPAEANATAGWLEIGPGERVRLPVHFRRIHDLIQRHMQRANKDFLAIRGTPALIQEDLEENSGPENESQNKEQPPKAAKPRRQLSCVGTSFEAARHIFKLANHYFGKSLAHFLLDGWVTEHVRILQEISQMYRTMQFWEQDPKRSAAMLSRRARMLSPLLDVINPKVYVAFWKQMCFEMAEVYQELYELKANGKMPGGPFKSLVDEEDDEAYVDSKRGAQCNELARKSSAFYGRFVDSYHPDGKVPERIDDDNVRGYLLARLNHARMGTKLQGISIDDQVEVSKIALREYEWILDYGNRNQEVWTKPEISMAQEMMLCKEMAAMLPSKLSQLAAKRRR